MLKKVFALAAIAGFAVAAPALAATTQRECPAQAWSFAGPFGGYDQEQLQRGFKVYREVCSSCHSLSLIAFRNLGDPGGPFWDPKYKNSNDNAYVKSIIADYKISDTDPDTGDPTKRPATTADYFPPPFPNDAAARASNGGALPPDMSLLAAARDGGPNYIYCLVGLGFEVPAPAGLAVPVGKYYNPYYAGDLSSFWNGSGPAPEGGVLGMPPPLSPNKVTFDDGTKSTTQQEARDVAAFLKWASDPKLEERKETGLAVMVFLAIFSTLVWFSYRRIWRDVAH